MIENLQINSWKWKKNTFKIYVIERLLSERLHLKGTHKMLTSDSAKIRDFDSEILRRILYKFKIMRKRVLEKVVQRVDSLQIHNYGSQSPWKVPIKIHDYGPESNWSMLYKIHDYGSDGTWEDTLKLEFIEGLLKTIMPQSPWKDH